MAEIEIEIDGQKLTAEADQMVIQAADAAGIYIPRFCYHKHLSIAANCRMCLVDIEKSPKPMPACATPVMPGMKVFTKSQKTRDAQRAVMEFLLINHPLDCPICDQGGECELQDLSMGYGASQSHYDECKRAVADENIGPLIATEMTRCILCTRCVRFGAEVAGMRELGVTNRGEHAEIKTYVDHAVTSEVSGNIIDLCPVGALTSKPYRFTARAWELDQAPSISPHDCLGSNIHVHTRYGKVMRVVSRENSAINETWLSDRDRFSYTGLYHADRLLSPMVKVNGEWQVVEWEKALAVAASALQSITAAHGPDNFGALASPNATVEEFYLLQKLTRALGSHHVDHRLRQIDTKDDMSLRPFPGLKMPIEALETCDAVILIGSNIRHEQPLAATRLRKASLKGATIIAINPVDYDFNFKVTGKVIVAPHQLPNQLADFVEASCGAPLADQTIQSLLAMVKGKQNIAIILGALAHHHPEASLIRFHARKLAHHLGGTLHFLTEGANSAGGWLAGAIPMEQGLNAYEMLAKPRKAYVLLNVEPDLDCANPSQAVDALKSAECVVALSLYRHATIDQYAHVLLPIAPFTETAGTFVNAAGEWQSFKGVAKPCGASRPAWKVLRVLGNYLQLEGFQYEQVEAVREDVKAQAKRQEPAVDFVPVKTSAPISQLSRIGEIPLYATDSLVRRAIPLQMAQPLMIGEIVARLHPETATQFKLVDGDVVTIEQAGCVTQLPIVVDARIAKEAVWIPAGIQATRMLGDLMGPLKLWKR